MMLLPQGVTQNKNKTLNHKINNLHTENKIPSFSKKKKSRQYDAGNNLNNLPLTKYEII